MRKIILITSLFFCLALTTILAQVVTTNISAPNSSGLSSNSVGDFDVNSDGTILNNSATSGTATLGSTAVTGNSNIPAGGEASLILFQVTGTSGSDLDGTIEVFGGEAGLIIANPNGITCDGCAFTNVNRVDLVTGSGYTASTDTFSIIDVANITVEGDALNLSNVDLNIQTRRNFSNDVAINADSLTVMARDFKNTSTINVDNLNVTAGNVFDNDGTIDAETVTIEVTNFNNDIENSGTVSSDSLNIIFTDDLVSHAASFNTFSFNNLAITADGNFKNYTPFELDNLTIKTRGNFSNYVNITVDSFTAIVGAYFIIHPAHINAASFTATVGGNFNNQSSSTINADNFTLTANNFNPQPGSTIDADTITIEVANFASNIDNAGTVSAASLNFILTDDFTHSSDSFTNFTNFSNLAITTEGTFTNNDTIDLDGNLTITANSFDNSGGVLISDALTVSLAGDFDYLANYLGTITINTLNLNVGGDFSYNDSASNFTWRANDTLTVSGNADITTNNYTQNGAIDVTGVLTINVESDFLYNRPNNDFIWDTNDSLVVSGNANITTNNFANGGTISTNTLALSVAGDFDYAANFLNQGTITANTSNLQVGGDFSNNDSANDFVWGDSDTLTVSGNADITTNNYTQSGAITVDGVWTINALTDFTYSNTNNDFSWDTNDSLTVGRNANITASNYIQSGAITVAGIFTINALTDFTYSNTNNNFIWDAQNTLTVLGNANITANNYNQYGAIDVAGVLTINANNYTYDRPNSDFVLAENDSLSILGDFTIDTNNYIQFGTLEVSGDLAIDAESDFANRGNITVTGALAIDAESNFANSGNITVTDSLEITAGYTAINQGSIVSANLDLTADDFFRNLTGGDIAVASLNITAGGKVTNTANINVEGTLNITANNDSSRDNDPTGFYVSNRGNITATTLNIAAVDNFYNRGNITATNFTTSAKSVFFLNKEIDSFVGTYDGGNISLNGNSSFIADGGIIENYGNIDLGVFNLDISADSFTNQSGANVTADTLNLTVNSFIQNGSIDATIDQ